MQNRKMKKNKCFLFVLLLCVVSVSVLAKDIKDDVMLVVSADGTTKEEAVKNALYSAIEQTYGVFVSANTTLLNDTIVKDEVITISSGNIKEYEEISVTNLPNGKLFVTLRAVVNVTQLVNYAQNKGMQVEFSGNEFTINLNRKILNRKNEAIAIKNLFLQVAPFILNSFDYQLEIGSPQMRQYRKRGSNIVGHIPLFVQALPNENLNIATDLMVNTLQQLSLTKDEILDYENHNIPFYVCNFSIFNNKKSFKQLIITTRTHRWKRLFEDLFIAGSKNFAIVDNLGEIIDSSNMKEVSYSDDYVIIEGESRRSGYFKDDLRRYPGDRGVQVNGKSYVLKEARRRSRYYDSVGALLINMKANNRYRFEKNVEDFSRYTKFEIKTNVSNVEYLYKDIFKWAEKIVNSKDLNDW